MKLVFPGGEHAPVELAVGTLHVGSGSDCGLVLAAPGIAARHAAILSNAEGIAVRPLDAAATTVLNGRRVDRERPLKPGDLLLFGRIGCTVAASGPVAAKAAPAPVPAPRAAEAVGTDGRTRVRASLPRFVLRGVSGATFGKTFTVVDGAVVGRQADCDIALPVEEVSRRHARLRVVAEGLQVEDLGSANGSFINDQRIQSGLLRPGDELRLDTVRFLLVAPGTDARRQALPRVEEAQAPRRVAARWLAAGALAAAVLTGLYWAGVF